jgi:hypothetical protein
MSAIIPKDGNLERLGYAYDSSAPNDRKFARIAVLQAEFASNYQISWDDSQQSSIYSADYIEWARFRSFKDLRENLKSRCSQLTLLCHFVRGAVLVETALAYELFNGQETQPIKQLPMD